MNNRGIVNMFLLVGLLIIFMGAIVLIVFGIVSININSALNQNVEIGQVNLATVNAQTIGKFNEMVVNNADFWGLGIIFGTILGLWGGAYFTRNSFPRLGIIIDIGFIFLAFLVSLYFRAIYSETVIALVNAGQTFPTDYLTRTNFIMLNLPIFIAIIGVVSMIIFYMRLPPRAEELALTSGGVVTG